MFCSARCRVAYHRTKRNTPVTDNSAKTILSLYDYSGRWSRPYKEAGYTVIQVDLKHGQDVRLLKNPGKVYGILAAPPCTKFSISGNAWKRTDAEMLYALSTVDAVMRFVHVCRPAFWALENPVGKLKYYLGDPKYYFHPCDFGDFGENYTKKTCLWGEFVAPQPKNPIASTLVKSGHHSIDEYWARQGIRRKDRTLYRSMTPLGFSYAFFEVNQ